MNVSIKTYKKRIIHLDIDPSDKLEKIKTRVFEFHSKVHLVFDNNILDTSKTAKDYGITENSVITLAECVH